jgi:hypothetical protein
MDLNLLGIIIGKFLPALIRKVPTRMLPKIFVGDLVPIAGRQCGDIAADIVVLIGGEPFTIEAMSPLSTLPEPAINPTPRRGEKLSAGVATWKYHAAVIYPYLDAPCAVVIDPIHFNYPVPVGSYLHCMFPKGGVDCCVLNSHQR